MKKLFLFSLFILSINYVYASECNIQSYYKYVDLINFEYIQLGTTETFKVYVNNLKNGISIESGKFLSSDGFFDYINYDSEKFINVVVSDGSVCSGEIVKILSLSVPGSYYDVISDLNNCNGECEISYEPPLLNQNISSEIINNEKNNYYIYFLMFIVFIIGIILYYKNKGKISLFFYERRL